MNAVCFAALGCRVFPRAVLLCCISLSHQQSATGSALVVEFWDCCGDFPAWATCVSLWTGGHRLAGVQD